MIYISIKSGFAAGKKDQADGLPDDQRVPHLRPFNITAEGELTFETKKYVPIHGLEESDYCGRGEVLFNNTNSKDLVGKSTVFDIDKKCAVSNHITRLKLKEGVNPYYVAACFNLLLQKGYWKFLSTNFNNQSGINIETLKTVKIPFPEDTEIQDKIVDEIMKHRNRANQLREKAEYELEMANKEFEKELLTAVKINGG